MPIIMSPTDAMLMRIADLSGSRSGSRSGSGVGNGGVGAGSGTSTSAGFVGGAGTGSGCVAHAVSSDSANRQTSCRRSVVTEADAEYVDLRCTQAAAEHVQLVEIVGGSDVNAMVVAVVNLDTLDV